MMSRRLWTYLWAGGRGQGETSPQLWAGPLPTDSAAFTLALSLMWAPRGAALADNGITNPLPPCP